jgi:hypothetical protein
VIERFELSEVEKRSPLWMRLDKFLATRLELHRMQNDGDKDPIATAHLRGRIAEIKFLRALGEEPRQLTDD